MLSLSNLNAQIEPENRQMNTKQSRLKKIAGLTLATLCLGAIAASAQTLNLWNINFAGHENNATPITVDDGLVLQAGSFGGNQWNNIIAPQRDPYVPETPLSMQDANGGNSIGLSWVEDGPLAGNPLNVHHGTNTFAAGSALFHGYYGVGNIDSTMQFRNLDPNAIYNLYVYFTWGWNENSVDYSITAGSGSILQQTLNPNRDTATYNDMTEGANYSFFPGISPAGDAIDLRIVSSDGGVSAIQLVQVPEPSTYAAILGGLFLAFALWRRRK